MPPKTAQPAGSNRKADTEPFSDASSSYWPEGWSWARYSDPEADFSTLSEEEKETTRQGLQEALGDDGMRRMRLYIEQNRREWEDNKLREQGVPPPEYDAPDFLKQRQKRHPDGPWGFVAFRTTLYDDEEKWNGFKDRIRRILQVPFDQVVKQHRGHEYEEVSNGRRSFELHWIDDMELDGASAETLRKRYAQLKRKDMPAGMDYDMFLCASPGAVESVLSLNDNNLPTTKSPFWRDDAPFLLVVMEEAEVNPHGDEEEHDPDDPHDERNWYKSVFKVPVEIIPDHLWDLADRAFMQPTRLTRGVRASTELGGTMPENYTPDGLSELWWGMAPSPRALRRRRGQAS